MNVENSEAQPPDRLDGLSTVNGQMVRLDDHKPTGEQILAAAGCEPADNFILIELLSPGAKVIAIDEPVRLPPGGGVFLAFEGGEIFQFTVNTHGYFWGRAEITSEEIRHAAGVGDEDDVVWQRDDEGPSTLGPGQRVDLAARGTEHFRTHKGLIEVFLDRNPKKIHAGTYTTAELIGLLGVQPGYLLNLQTSTGLKPLKDGETLTVEKGMCFFSQLPGGASS